MDLRTGARERCRAASGCAPTPGVLRFLLLATAALAALGAGAAAGRAENLTGALVKAYVNNPTINSSRAAVRAADENVPIANSGYLPNIAAGGTIGVQHSNLNQIFPDRRQWQAGGPEFQLRGPSPPLWRAAQPEHF